MLLCGSFLSLLDNIIYYEEFQSFPGEIEYESKVPLVMSKSHDNISHNAFITNKYIANQLNNSKQSNNDDFNTVYLEFNNQNNIKNKNQWILCFQSRMNVNIGIIIQLLSVINNDNKISPQQHKQIISTFDSIYFQIQQYFVESIEIPLYIIKMRYHQIFQKLIFQYNHPSVYKTFKCCTTSCKSNNNLIQLELVHHDQFMDNYYDVKSDDNEKENKKSDDPVIESILNKSKKSTIEMETSRPVYPNYNNGNTKNIQLDILNEMTQKTMANNKHIEPNIRNITSSDA